MRRSRFSYEQIIRILKQREAGVETEDICREHGITPTTFYHWRSKYGEQTVTKAERLKLIENENRRLKKRLEDMKENCDALKGVIRSNGWSQRA